MTRIIVLCFLALLATAGRTPATPAAPEMASALSVTSSPMKLPKGISQFPFGIQSVDAQPIDHSAFAKNNKSKTENGSIGLIVAGMLLVLFRWLQPAFSPRRFH